MSEIVELIEKYFELEPGKPIKLFDYQKEILECDAKFRLILKARQLGISSVIAWEALAYALLYPNQTILLVSVSERQARELMNYVKRVRHVLSQKALTYCVDNNFNYSGICFSDCILF